MSRKVYISGAISGLPYEEYTDWFTRAEVYLEANGHTPVNPLKVIACLDESCSPVRQTLPDGSFLHSWQCYMRHDIIEMLKSDAVAMLPNWRASKGADLEREVALRCGMEILFFTHDLSDLY